MERLRAICLALPETSEKVAWGEQESLLFLDPQRFFRPPYVGPRGWVGVRIDRGPDWKLVTSLVKQAYREVAPPRLREAVKVTPPRVLERRRD